VSLKDDPHEGSDSYSVVSLLAVQVYSSHEQYHTVQKHSYYYVLMYVSY